MVFVLRNFLVYLDQGKSCFLWNYRFEDGLQSTSVRKACEKFEIWWIFKTSLLGRKMIEFPISTYE